MGGGMRGRGLCCTAAVVVIAAGPAAVAAGPLATDCGAGRRPGCVAWADRWRMTDETARQAGRAIATSPDGSLVFVTGSRRDLAYEAASGLLVWSAANGAGGGIGGQDIAVNPSGSYVVTTGEGRYPHPNQVTGGEVVVTARHPPTGRELWQARHRDPDLETYTARAVAATDARVFVTGGRVNPYQLATFAFDAATGERLWLAHHGRTAGAGAAASSKARGVDIVASPDGARVFVTGFIAEREPFVEWVTIAYDGATGEELWTRSQASGTDDAAEPKEMVLHPDGRLLYVTGWGKQPRLRGGSFDFVTVAYDTSTGAVVWSDGFHSPFDRVAFDSDDLGWSVDMSPDGRLLYVAGFSEDPADPDPNGANYHLEARDARTGQEVWSAAVPFFVATQDAEGLFGSVKVRASPDAREVYVAVSAHDGASIAGSDIAYGVAGFDAAGGAFRWRGSYSQVDAPSYPKALAVDPHGRRIYATGQGGERAETSVQTVAFSVRIP